MHARDPSSRCLHPSAIEGPFEKNYMLEMLFSSLQSPPLLRCCRGAGFPCNTVLSSLRGTRESSQSSLNTLTHTFLPSDPPPGFNKSPQPLKTNRKNPFNCLKEGETAIKFPQTSNYDSTGGREERRQAPAASHRPAPCETLQTLENALTPGSKAPARPSEEPVV